MKLVATPAHASVSPPTVAASSSLAASAVPPIQCHYVPPLLFPEGGFAAAAAALLLCFFMHEPEGWEGAHSESSLSKHEWTGVCFLSCRFRNVPFKR